MRIGLGINYAGGFKEVAAEVADLERAGLDIVFVPEAYSFDAVSALGYLAAATERVELASGILQLYTRRPSLTALTAAWHAWRSPSMSPTSRSANARPARPKYNEDSGHSWATAAARVRAPRTAAWAYRSSPKC